jgi:transcription elongation GreA/GreB family factor
VDKTVLLQTIIDRLSADLARSFAAARAAEAGATDEQNKAENKYDTRGLELSYLAAGQGRQIAEAEVTLEQFRGMEVRAFRPDEAIDVGALVTLETSTARGADEALYFLAPRGGGTEVQLDGRDVLVITPKSPLGQQLLGRRVGERFTLGRDAGEHRVVAVC